MTMTEIKNKHLGMGLRRLRYEKRLERMKDRSPYDMGQKMGLGFDDSIMLQEYVEFQINSVLSGLFISSN